MRLYKVESGLQCIYEDAEWEDVYKRLPLLESVYGVLYEHVDYYYELVSHDWGVVLSYVPSTKMLHLPYKYFTFVMDTSLFEEKQLANGMVVYKKKD